MTEQEAPAPQRTRSRVRSPSFPFISLGKALERARAMEERHKTFATPRGTLAQTWGQKTTSSSFLQTVSALKAFGLIADEGSGEDRRFKLTDLALRILLDTREELRDAAAREAATKPPLLKEFQARWSSGRPSDEHCVSELQLDHGFNRKTAATFLNVFDKTFQFLGSGPLDSESDSNEREESGESSGDESPGDERPPPPRQHVQRKEMPGMKEDVFALAEGDAVLQWPTAISPESFTDLRDWLDLVLRKIERQALADDEATD